MPMIDRTADRKAVKDYAGSLLRELSRMSRRKGEPFLAYLIEMAAVEASSAIRASRQRLSPTKVSGDAGRGAALRRKSRR